MILYGRAGTGKTFVINCLRNEYPNQILVSATTGKAATNIQGKTIHSSLLLPVGAQYS